MTHFRRAFFMASLALTMTLAHSTFAQTVRNVYSFTGAGPSAGPGVVTLAQGRNGQLYGTTQGTLFGSAFAVSTGGHRD